MLCILRDDQEYHTSRIVVQGVTACKGLASFLGKRKF
jgi:hypothetical protein